VVPFPHSPNFLERRELGESALIMASSHPGIQTDADQPKVVLSNRHRWGVVWLLTIAAMINYFDRAAVSFALQRKKPRVKRLRKMRGHAIPALFAKGKKGGPAFGYVTLAASVAVEHLAARGVLEDYRAVPVAFVIVEVPAPVVFDALFEVERTHLPEDALCDFVG